MSVVIPCFNDAVLLRRVLGSLVRQSVPADEIIVVDNNSTDASAAVAREFAGVHVVTEARQGITWAAAAGYDAAQGDLIVRTDADAVVPPDYIAWVHREWEDAQLRPGNQVVGLTGPAEFELPGRPEWFARVVSALYLGAYFLTTGSALGHRPLFGTNCVLSAAWWRSVRGAVSLDDAEVHDDLHLSFAVRPGETVRYAPQLRVRMDGRALRGGRQLVRRFRRGFHTMGLNFKVNPPHRRLLQRITH